MTEEEKQLIANEVDKYFISRRINAAWFSSHLNPTVIIPSDGFEPQSLSNISIECESIKELEKDLYEFSGSADCVFMDAASKIKRKASVEFGGEAICISVPDRIAVRDVNLTRFHRTSEIIPK